MRKAAIIVLSVLLIATVVIGLKLYRENDDDTAEYNRMISYFSEIKPDTAEQNDYLAEIRKINPDIAAWITIPDTDIDFPIVQCDDNEYYLSHDIEKNESYMGVPFLDYRNSGDFSDFNSIIYGHNIKNGQMFAGLTYFKQSDYFNSHTYGILTLADGMYRIEFIACDVLESDGFAYNVVFLSDKERKVFLKNIREKAVQMRDFSDDDLVNANLCTFSTCSYEFSDARTILIGYISEKIDKAD
jgi:sortase B